ncbi:MAG TPA: hypothetical protein VI583_13465 [Cyclobacteriaceae bacterium]|nr:hypothetical protein [Cyclobacteriaceae bacterium]
MRPILIIYFTVLWFTSPALAEGRIDRNSDESILIRMKNRAENAREGDWKILADCAEKLISRGIANDEILSWIEKSICVEENYYNLSLLGDYFHLKQDYSLAKQFYVKALLMAQKVNNPDAMRRLQWKILISMGTENYYNSVGTPSR